MCAAHRTKLMLLAGNNGHLNLLSSKRLVFALTIPSSRHPTTADRMEDLSSAVSKIQVDLNSSRQRLTTLEGNARRSVSGELSCVRTALKASDNKIEHAAVEIRSYLHQIDNVPNAQTSVDMAPQITWAHNSLQSIAASFEDALGAAGRAMQCTTAYSYSVLDIGQEVEQSRDKLSQCQAKATMLGNQASSALKTSEDLLLDAKREITAKEAEIARKTAEAAATRRRKTQLESQISQKKVAVADAKRLQESKKEDVAIGVVSYRPIPSRERLGEIALTYS